jgi:hypothetical protein
MATRILPSGDSTMRFISHSDTRKSADTNA